MGTTEEGEDNLRRDQEEDGRTGVGYDELFKNSNLPIPTGVRDMIYAIMGEMERAIVDVHCLVAAFFQLGSLLESYWAFLLLFVGLLH